MIQVNDAFCVERRDSVSVSCGGNISEEAFIRGFLSVQNLRFWSGKLALCRWAMEGQNDWGRLMGRVWGSWCWMTRNPKAIRIADTQRQEEKATPLRTARSAPFASIRTFGRQGLQGLQRHGFGTAAPRFGGEGGGGAGVGGAQLSRFGCGVGMSWNLFQYVSM